MGDAKKTLRIVILCVAMLVLGSLITRVSDMMRTPEVQVPQGGWTKLQLVLSQIDQNYVDEVDRKGITEDILPKLLEKLDPHSVYLPPKNLEEATEELQGNFDGIGITFNIPQDTAIVISVISGGPSERAGLIPGDRILSVDGKAVAGVKINQDSLVSKMRGVSGTKVKLEILREKEVVDFEITRAKIPVNSIDVAYMINDTTGYMKLTKFTRTSYKEFRGHVVSLLEQGMTKLIFDLQDNTGGYLDQALYISNEFLPAGKMIVYMDGLHRKREEFKSTGEGICQELDLMVLVNQNSASSSEIFAGAMQDNDRGVIIGRRSFGKGVVQEPIYFSDNSGIRLTVARFYTPSGRCIQKPYSSDSQEEYALDIYDRYLHGEMTSVDSIPKNDSLKYQTVSGRTVYGGGGITPDIFVPIDTVGVTDLLVKINRQAYTIKYSSLLADKYRKQLRAIDDISELNSFLSALDLENGFLSYLKGNSVDVKLSDWEISKDIVLTQLRALVGRYSPLDDYAFYSILAELDNMLTVAVETPADWLELQK